MFFFVWVEQSQLYGRSYCSSGFSDRLLCDSFNEPGSEATVGISRTCDEDTKVTEESGRQLNSAVNHPTAEEKTTTNSIDQLKNSADDVRTVDDDRGSTCEGLSTKSDATSTNTNHAIFLNDVEPIWTNDENISEDDGRNHEASSDDTTHSNGAKEKNDNIKSAWMHQDIGLLPRSLDSYNSVLVEKMLHVITLSAQHSKYCYLKEYLLVSNCMVISEHLC